MNKGFQKFEAAWVTIILFWSLACMRLKATWYSYIMNYYQTINKVISYDILTITTTHDFREMVTRDCGHITLCTHLTMDPGIE